MKISFSTLGCPDWSWEEITATARDFGFDGIEVRGIENEIYVPHAKPFTENNLKATLEKLERLNLEIPCITSSCYLFNKLKINKYMREGMEYVDLAQKIGARYVRVLGDANPEPSSEIDTAFVTENLCLLAQYAENKGVKILLETNGVFADSDTILSVIERVNSPALGILWDMHHPFRFMNEPVEKTYNSLKKYIEFVHIKDSVMEDGRVKYRMMGYGDVPVKTGLELLKAGGYEGYVSLEWVKRWCMELEEPGIVLPHFINYVKNIIG
ncbi:MAG TPA: sugar phosphate isomerase/epimerase [Clostridiaceae bacterium]|nr:sugar phosphate isomerase/epimerase [Clostridiaceae bacterium]